MGAISNEPPKVHSGNHLRKGVTHVVCTHAASQWYAVNKVYKVEVVAGKRCVQGSDGFWDQLEVMKSHFVEHSPGDVIPGD